MTREEQIREAIDKTFPCTNEGRCYEQALGASGFELGVKWADKHPNIEDIWHKASEYPKFEFEYIVYYSSHISKYEIDKPFNIINLYGGIEYLWSLVIKNLGITKWTYLETLLSKSGAKIV